MSSPSSKAPQVSVVIPVFNEPAATLLASLNSVRRQTFEDFECLIVDESSSDESAQACAQVCALDDRFLHIRPPNRLGLAASLNLAISQSRGQLIARFDADDICAPARFAKQVSHLNAHPELHVLGSAMRIIDNDGKSVGLRRYPLHHGAISKRMQITNALGHPSLMIRKAAFAQWGAYDPDFRYSEDLDLWLRWLNAGARFANMEEALIDYRQQFTFRNQSHWEHNLRARRKNWANTHLPERVLGLLTVSLWRLIPQRIQETLYRRNMLRRASQTISP